MKQRIDSGFRPIQLAFLAIAVCLFLVAWAYLYAYMYLDKSAIDTFVYCIPCTVVGVALVVKVIHQIFKQ